ncbi:hypothetical protein [Rhizobium sp. K102]|uniref:hypothetical protein n=1 Tax=Rhizobium sp. K102 TaxID=2918527 RepID=UPI001EFA65B3|nr:hypothetical protein [Rhizobium sp. K102]ULR44344.1 hypothetical protein MHI61_24925 [Rhizobium sp. K102]
MPKIAASRAGFDVKMLEPVNGIDYRTYGHITYAMFLDPDGDHEAIFKKLGTDRAGYEAAGATFSERMKQDQTFAMVEMFGAYFAEEAQGTYAALGRDVAQSVLNQAPLRETEPMPEEKFREIQVYYGRKVSVAGTALAQQDEILKPYHITFNDFNIVGAWFSRRLALQTADLSTPQESPPARAEGTPTERPEWGGLWRFTWKTLQHTDTEMKVVERKPRHLCQERHDRGYPAADAQTLGRQMRADRQDPLLRQRCSDERTMRPRRHRHVMGAPSPTGKWRRKL